MTLMTGSLAALPILAGEAADGSAFPMADALDGTERNQAEETIEGTVQDQMESPEDVVTDQAEEMIEGSAPDQVQELLADEAAEAADGTAENAAVGQTEETADEAWIHYMPGDLYTFGSYVMAAEAGSEAEPVTWVVLDVKMDRLLLLSREALDCLPYQDTGKPAVWAECSLRSFLNGEFLQTAFTEEEKQQVLPADVANEANPDYGTAGGGNTEDYVFLLSISEAKKYFSFPELQEYSACTPTAYAVSRGAWTAPATGSCWWWLRSPGHTKGFATGVGHTGIAGTYGTAAGQTICAVRPAIWISIPVEAISEEEGTSDNISDDFQDNDSEDVLNDVTESTPDE